MFREEGHLGNDLIEAQRSKKRSRERTNDDSRVGLFVCFDAWHMVKKNDSNVCCFSSLPSTKAIMIEINNYVI